MFKHKRNGFDALGTVAVAFGASTMAARNPTLRYTIDGSDSMFKDWRFIGGALGAVAAGMDRGMVGRVGQDVAVGAFSSLVSTEAVRRQAEAAAMQAQQQQIPAGQGAPSAAFQGAYAPAWM